MEQIADLIQKSTDEIRKYEQTSPNAHHFEGRWFNGLVQHLEIAGRLSDPKSVQDELNAIFHSISDCGPIESGFAPSLHMLAKAVQQWCDRMETDEPTT